MRIGMGEILVVLIIALVIFGPKQLPKLGKTLGKAFGQFKHYTDFSSNWDLDDEDDEDEKPKKKKKAAVKKENKSDASPGTGQAEADHTIEEVKEKTEAVVEEAQKVQESVSEAVKEAAEAVSDTVNEVKDGAEAAAQEDVQAFEEKKGEI